MVLLSFYTWSYLIENQLTSKIHEQCNFKIDQISIQSLCIACESHYFLAMKLIHTHLWPPVTIISLGSQNCETFTRYLLNSFGSSNYCLPLLYDVFPDWRQSDRCNTIVKLAFHHFTQLCELLYPFSWPFPFWGRYFHLRLSILNASPLGFYRLEE